MKTPDPRARAGPYTEVHGCATMTRTHRFRVGTIFVVCLGLFIGQPDTCHADGAWSGMAALTTDYVFRGVSQTYDEPALQGGINYQNPSGWFGGAWASNVNPYPF